MSSATLALVTCGPALEVALAASSDGAISVVRLVGVSQRSRLLLLAVELLVEDAAIERDAIARVLVTRGPGSFTGIRAGLATGAGLAAAVGAATGAYSSLLAQAARVGGSGLVWAAQPGRRGEVYAQQFAHQPGAAPRQAGEILVLPVAELAGMDPWVGPENLDLGSAVRAPTARGAAEAMIVLDRMGAETEPLEPLYIEGPPIHGVGP